MHAMQSSAKQVYTSPDFESKYKNAATKRRQLEKVINSRGSALRLRKAKNSTNRVIVMAKETAAKVAHTLKTWVSMYEMPRNVPVIALQRNVIGTKDLDVFLVYSIVYSNSCFLRCICISNDSVVCMRSTA